MNECSICLSEINNLSHNNLLVWKDDYIDSVYKTTCGHTFHFNCIHDWLISNDDCPCCRTVLLDIEYTNNSIYDIFTEYCPNKQQPVWKRVTCFSNSPDIESIQSVYRDKKPRNIIQEREPDRNVVSTARSRVIPARKSIFGRMITYINRILR